MAKNRIAYYTQGGRTVSATLNGDGSIDTVFTAGANGSRILAIYVTDYSGAPTGLRVYHNDGANNYLVYLKSGAVSLGDDLLESSKMPKGSSGLRYINIEAGDSIRASLGGTGAGDTIALTVYGEDY